MALLDAEPDEAFRRIARIACRLFDVPDAFVGLIDEDGQWFVSGDGAVPAAVDADVSSTAHRLAARAVAPHVIAADSLLVVPDARRDVRFRDQPFVVEGNVGFCAGAPIRSPDGHAVGVFSILDRRRRHFDDGDARSLEDLAAVVEREIEMHQRACLDEVTGVYNRRGFVAVGRRLLARAVRRGTAVAVAYLDVDGLKGVNDEHGHSVGDRALVAVARALRAGTRASDVVGRLGGDEFGLLLFDCSKQACDSILGELERRFADDLATIAPGLDVGWSAGAAGAAGDVGAGLDELMRLADAEMYARKAAKQRT